MTKPVWWALVGALALLGLAAFVGLLIVLTGGYNVAATERHTTIGGWVLDTTFRNSVQGRADAIDPPRFTQAMVAAGAGEYKAMCAQCHGGIGEGRAGWAQGMRPKPPPLASAAREWSEAEVFWLVTNGVRMTGMPAFGPTHDEATRWNLVAFVKAMPEMTASDYAAFPKSRE